MNWTGEQANEFAKAAALVALDSKDEDAIYYAFDNLRSTLQEYNVQDQYRGAGDVTTAEHIFWQTIRENQK